MVQKVIKEAGIEQRRAYTKKTKVEHVCFKCHKHIPIAGASFCPWCGADARSERVICAEELTRVIGIVSDMPIPSEQKDRAMKALRDAIRLLKEDAVE